MQVGSRTEESQVRGCYNEHYCNQPGKSEGSPLKSNMCTQAAAPNNSAASGGTLGKRVFAGQGHRF